MLDLKLNTKSKKLFFTTKSILKYYMGTQYIHNKLTRLATNFFRETVYYLSKILLKSYGTDITDIANWLSSSAI